MQASPQKGHAWLNQLVGEWDFVADCQMGPGQPVEQHRGSERVRSLGGLWVLGEGEGELPGGSRVQSLITLGYDPAQQRFVGTFIASMMDCLWIYNGQLDAVNNKLTLDTTGPGFKDGNQLVAYQDVVQFVDDNTRLLISHVQDEQGHWSSFMTARYTRRK
jgi:hypothetical protein